MDLHHHQGAKEFPNRSSTQSLFTQASILGLVINHRNGDDRRHGLDFLPDGICEVVRHLQAVIYLSPARSLSVTLTDKSSSWRFIFKAKTSPGLNAPIAKIVCSK